MKINLTTQIEILTIHNGDLDVDGDLYKYFDEELEKNPTKTNIKTLAYNVDNDENEELVLLIFDKDKEERFTQKKITLKND
jgi:hypothetical protein